jgi:hypothetical protein
LLPALLIFLILLTRILVGLAALLGAPCILLVLLTVTLTILVALLLPTLLVALIVLCHFLDPLDTHLTGAKVQQSAGRSRSGKSY